MRDTSRDAVTDADGRFRLQGLSTAESLELTARRRPDLIAALDSVTTIGNEWGTEAYYNFNLAPAVSLGLDLQVIEPGLGTSTAVFTGIRLVTRF